MIVALTFITDLFPVEYKKRTNNKVGQVEIDATSISAVLEDKVIGKIKYDVTRITHETICPKHTYRCHITKLYIGDHYRQKGIGRALIEQSLRDMQQKGCTTAELNSVLSAREFYKKCGFEIDYCIERPLCFKNMPWYLQFIPRKLYLKYETMQEKFLCMVPMKYNFIRNDTQIRDVVGKIRLDTRHKKREQERLAYISTLCTRFAKHFKNNLFY